MDSWIGRWASLWLILLGSLLLGGCSGSSDARSVRAEGVVERAPAATSPEAPSAEGPGSEPESPPPTVNLSASQDVVASGQHTTLSWSSAHATGCRASGGWSGDLPVSGSARVGPITESTTYTLSCEGAGGNAMAMISLRALGVVTLQWQPPDENVDGSPLVGLSGYRIYLGTVSRQYTDEVPVNDASSTSRSLELPSGAYYIAMTAVDVQGNESAYSNEIVRSVN